MSNQVLQDSIPPTQMRQEHAKCDNTTQKNKPKTAQKSNNVGLSRLLALSGEKKSTLIFSSLLSGIAAIVGFVPYFVAYLIVCEFVMNAGDVSAVDKDYVLLCAIIALASVIVNVLLVGAAFTLSHFAAYRILYNLRLRLCKHLSTLSLGYFTATSKGEIHKSIQDNVEKLEEFIAHKIPEFVQAFVGMVALFVCFFVIDWRFGLLSLFVFVLSLIVQFSIYAGQGNGSVKQSIARFYDSLEKINAASLEFVKGISIVKMFGKSIFSFQSFAKSVQGYKDYALDFTFACMPTFIIFNLLVHNFILFLLPVAAVLIADNPMDIVLVLTVLFFIMLQNGLVAPFMRLFNLSRALMEINEGISRVDRIFAVKPLPQVASPRVPSDSGITFENVSFGYDTGHLASGNHSQDSKKIEGSQTSSLASPPIFLENQQSNTANLRMRESGAESHVNSESIARSATESRPLRGAEHWEKESSSAFSNAKLEAEEARLSPCLPMQSQQGKKAAAFFGVKGSEEGINPFFATQGNGESRNYQSCEDSQNAESQADSRDSKPCHTEPLGEVSRTCKDSINRDSSVASLPKNDKDSQNPESKADSKTARNAESKDVQAEGFLGDFKGCEETSNEIELDVHRGSEFQISLESGKKPTQSNLDSTNQQNTESSEVPAAIKNISFKLEQGESLAIIGESGSGKSTILSLLARFYDVSSGSIKIGGVDVREMSEATLMEQISFVFQESFIFLDSLRENIAAGKAVSDEAILEAAHLAQCDEIIAKFGLDAQIGDKNTALSGGEAQRIAIARAILKNAPILLLDEVHSALDSENALKISKAIDNLKKGKTLIMVAHNLSSTLSADRIALLDKGQIVALGTHKELMESCEAYQKLWEMYADTQSWKIAN